MTENWNIILNYATQKNHFEISCRSSFYELILWSFRFVNINNIRCETEKEIIFHFVTISLSICRHKNPVPVCQNYWQSLLLASFKRAAKIFSQHWWKRFCFPSFSQFAETQPELWFSGAIWWRSGSFSRVHISPRKWLLWLSTAANWRFYFPFFSFPLHDATPLTP